MSNVKSVVGDFVRQSKRQCVIESLGPLLSDCVPGVGDVFA